MKPSFFLTLVSFSYIAIFSFTPLCSASVSIPAGASSTSEVSGSVGGDKDAHGCYISAGYSWNSLNERCERPWENTPAIWTIAPQKVLCEGTPSGECFSIKIGRGEWKSVNETLDGFQFEPGYTYRVRVVKDPIPQTNPTTVAPKEFYTVKTLISKTPLRGSSWTLESFNGEKVTSSGSITFHSNGKYNGSFCNGFGGIYGIYKKTLSFRNGFSTQMYCESDNMKVENAFFSTKKARFSLQEGELILIADDGQKIIWKSEIK